MTEGSSLIPSSAPTGDKANRGGRCGGLGIKFMLALFRGVGDNIIPYIY